MSLHDFVSQVQSDIVLDSRFMGIKATYSRRVEDKEGDTVETKSVKLNVSPQGNFVASDKAHGQIGTRINIFWAKTKDLKFGKEPFLPMENDVIEYKVNRVPHKYTVVKTQDMTVPSNLGQRATFGYEDALHRIIKIMTVKEL